MSVKQLSKHQAHGGSGEESGGGLRALLLLFTPQFSLCNRIKTLVCLSGVSEIGLEIWRRHPHPHSGTGMARLLGRGERSL